MYSNEEEYFDPWSIPRNEKKLLLQFGEQNKMVYLSFGEKIKCKEEKQIWNHNYQFPALATGQNPDRTSNRMAKKSHRRDF